MVSLMRLSSRSFEVIFEKGRAFGEQTMLSGGEAGRRGHVRIVLCTPAAELKQDMSKLQVSGRE